MQCFLPRDRTPIPCQIGPCCIWPTRSSPPPAAGRIPAAEWSTRFPDLTMANVSARIQPFVHQVFQLDRRPAEHQPRRRELRAHLPPEVAGHVAVIPDTPAQPAVDDQPDEQLERGHDCRALHHLQQHRRVILPLVQQADQHEAQPAQHTHRPVGMPAPEDLNAHVHQPTDHGDRDMYQQLFQGLYLPGRAPCLREQRLHAGREIVRQLCAVGNPSELGSRRAPDPRKQVVAVSRVV